MWQEDKLQGRTMVRSTAKNTSKSMQGSEMPQKLGQEGKGGNQATKQRVREGNERHLYYYWYIYAYVKLSLNLI